MSEKLHEINRMGLSCEAFQIFQNATPLLTAGNAEKLNTMVIGWGGLGTLWSLPVCTVYVRPQRYTYEFMERSDSFSVSVLPRSGFEKALRVCGSESGRDVDKVQKCGLTPAFGAQGTPYFEEAELVLVCRKLYADDLRPEKFVDRTIDGRVYPTHDYHRMYIGEVVQVLQK